MRRLGGGEGPVGLVLLGRGLGDGLLTQSNFFFFGRLDALVVRGRVGFTFQSRVISVKSRLRALLGRLEPRDLRRRVVDGLLELFSTLRSQARGAVLGPTFGFLGLLGLGLVGLCCGFLLEGLGFAFGFRGACVLRLSSSCRGDGAIDASAPSIRRRHRHAIDANARTPLQYLRPPPPRSSRPRRTRPRRRSAPI